jgi:hypothetical protein
LPKVFDVVVEATLDFVAAESVGAFVVVAVVSWPVGLESQPASNRAVLRPVAKSAERWEIGMKKRMKERKITARLLIA